MSQEKLAPFAGEKYLNFESYRQNGAAIRTPLWFAEGDGLLYVYTLSNTAKVKRVRRNPRVRVAPCDFRGRLKGEWVDGTVTILDGASAARGNELLDAKYGLLKRIGNLFSRLRGRERTGMSIKLD